LQKLKKAETLILVDFVECPKVEVVYGSSWKSGDLKMEDLDIDLME